MVTAASLASMGVSALSTFVLPIIILVVARRRWCCSLWSAAVGALVFVVFALLLEGGLHALVFAALPNLPSKPMLYTIYAALAAGVCEELGRVCGFAVLQRATGVPMALGAPRSGHWTRRYRGNTACGSSDNFSPRDLGERHQCGYE